MPITDEQVEWLEKLIGRCDEEHQQLSDWEHNFVEDQRKRFEQYGSKMFLSPKQLQVLQRIENKLDGEPQR